MSENFNTRFAPQEFAKVRVSANGATRFVRIIKTRKDGVIIGKRVTEEGEDWSRTVKDPKHGLVDQEEMIVFKPESIVKRMRLSLHYGLLEPTTSGEGK